MTGCEWKMKGGPRRGQSCGAGTDILCKNHKAKCVSKSKYYVGSGVQRHFPIQMDNLFRWLSVDPVESAFGERYQYRQSGREKISPSAEESQKIIRRAIETGEKLIEGILFAQTVQSLLPPILQFPSPPPFQFHGSYRPDEWGRGRGFAYHLVNGAEAATLYQTMFESYYTAVLRCGVFGGYAANRDVTVRVREVYDLGEDASENEGWAALIQGYSHIRGNQNVTQKLSLLEITSDKKNVNRWAERQQNKEIVWSLWKEELPTLIATHTIYADIFSTDWNLVERDVQERLEEWQGLERRGEPTTTSVSYGRERYTQGSE